MLASYLEVARRHMTASPELYKAHVYWPRWNQRPQHTAKHYDLQMHQLPVLCCQNLTETLSGARAH